MEIVTKRDNQKLLQKISYYVVLVLLLLIFISSGLMKLFNEEAIVNNFAKWQLSEWKNAIGTLEISLSFLLLIRPAQLISIILLNMLLIGAVFTHIKHAEPFFFPTGLILVLWINHFLIQPKNEVL